MFFRNKGIFKRSSSNLGRHLRPGVNLFFVATILLMSAIAANQLDHAQTNVRAEVTQDDLSSQLESPLLSLVTISPSKDNTLYESAAGSLSNGAGNHFFAGRTGPTSGSLIRRGVIAFDIAGSIPAGSTIDSVTLSLHMSRTVSGAQNVTLHKLLADWGEGSSNAPGFEGGGAAASPGDATWVHRFFNTANWASVGGDFFPFFSSSASVGGIGSYTWGSTAAMVSDVQSWLDNPATNFGWLLKGNESASTTTKRFDTKENTTPANRPVLVVDFTTNSPPVANAQSVMTDHDTPVDITLTGSDADVEDTLSFVVESLPGSGDLSEGPTAINSAPHPLSSDMVTYTPNVSFSGTDGFMFTVTDRKEVSTGAQISVTVKPGPEPVEVFTYSAKIVCAPLGQCQSRTDAG